MSNAAEDTAHVVQVQGLVRRYRGKGSGGQASVVTAVDDVSLSVKAGELVVLLGPSGCGKTTLLRSVAGLDKPDAGSIRLGGRTVFDAASGVFVPPEDRHIGMMFQSYALWPHMTVAQNVAYPLSSARGRAKTFEPQVSAMLDKLGVAGLGHRYPSELSGGQQQRVALARALIASPSLILFDEPLSNVDAKVRRRLRAELRELKSRTRFAGIYVTHDQEEAMELADTLVVMDAGKIRQSAAPRHVYAQPASLYVAEFVGEMNRWAGVVEAGDAVSTPVGRFALPSAARATARAGDRGWLGIRPENVVLTTAPDATLRATIGDVIHLGARIECRLHVEEHEMVVWLGADEAAVLPLSPGNTIGVALPQEHMRWLPN
ncbi:ABC transporter ATP-binding protein [Hydrogenophaga sp. 2FB]|uniref:ABC transporter ATP-binding protein n=1 Tax=Hydrogenophaga sp. 2FB TaxID=2502187 RepID=UPI001484D2B8|nr:ABC transporter ATP-binding protein [Hydrogenophaga sp. 2FB]